MSSFSESGRIGSTEGEFSVCQFFKGKADANPDDAAYEYTRRWVGGKEAVDAFFHYCTSVGAQMGWTVRVILTDGGDSINMEWTHVDGITFPQGPHIGRLKGGKDDPARGSGVRELRLVSDSTDGSGRGDEPVSAYDPDSVVSQEEVKARKGSGRDDSADEG